MDFTEFGILLAVTIGIAEVMKKTFLTSRYIPLATLVVGTALSILAMGVSTTTILTGLTIGLSSMGLYSGTKKTVKG